MIQIVRGAADIANNFSRRFDPFGSCLLYVYGVAIGSLLFVFKNADRLKRFYNCGSKP